VAPLIEIVAPAGPERDAAARAFATAPAEWSVELVDRPSGAAEVVVATGAEPPPGAVAFDPARPRDAVETVSERLSAVAHGARVVVVAGAVGGAGATTVALHLALEWAPGTCVCDLAGGVAPRLGLPEDARTWLPRDGDVAAAALPVEAGFRVLCAPSPCPAPDRFPLTAASAAFERLVVDAGTRPDLDPFAGGAHAVVLVTTPTRPGAEAARRIAAAHPGPRWAIVTNRTGPGGQIMRSGIETALGRPLTLELPSCPALRDAEDRGSLLRGRWHRWTRALSSLARALDRP
jgi:hypothetical protein